MTPAVWADSPVGHRHPAHSNSQSTSHAADRVPAHSPLASFEESHAQLLDLDGQFLDGLDLSRRLLRVYSATAAVALPRSSSLSNIAAKE